MGSLAPYFAAQWKILTKIDFVTIDEFTIDLIKKSQVK
jgi:hypothetical protein